MAQINGNDKFMSKKNHNQKLNKINKNTWRNNKAHRQRYACYCGHFLFVLSMKNSKIRWTQRQEWSIAKLIIIAENWTRCRSKTSDWESMTEHFWFRWTFRFRSLFIANFNSTWIQWHLKKKWREHLISKKKKRKWIFRENHFLLASNKMLYSA